MMDIHGMKAEVVTNDRLISIYKILYVYYKRKPNHPNSL